MKRTVILFFLFSGFVNLQGQTKAIHVETIGEGRDLVFLPGFTNPGSIWKEFLPELEIPSRAHLFTYAGFDQTEPLEFPWYPKVKKGIKQYIIDQNLREVILIGHSMGGNLAIDLAAEIPDRISKMVLVDSLPCMRELMFPGFTAEQMVYENPYNQQTLNMSDEDFKNMTLGMASQMSNNPNSHNQLAHWIQIADRKTYVYGYTDLLKLDQRTLLAEIKSPTLILGATEPYGAQAQVNIEKQYANLTSKKVVMIENSRHFILFDQKQKMAELINQFLDE